MEEYKSKLNIKSWAVEDRPREKLLLKGKGALSDAELIGILIGSGTENMSAVDVSKNILKHVGHDLNKLAKLTVKDLTRFKGIGDAKAINIISALELGRRRKDQTGEKRLTIKKSSDVYALMAPHLLDLPHEEFWVILLNRANTVITSQPVSSGGVSGTVADPKLIFKLALDNLASSMIVVHNHPSGNINPSEADIRLTKKLKEAGKLVEVPLLDHIIFAEDNYYSFADQGML